MKGRDLLREARRELGPTAAERARVHAAVLATVGAGAAAATVGAGAKVVAAAGGGALVGAAGRLVAVRLVVGIAAAMLVFGSVVAGLGTSSAPEPEAVALAPVTRDAVEPSPAPSTPVATAEPAPPAPPEARAAIPADPPERRAARAVAPSAPEAAPPPAELDVTGETLVLTRARAALERGDAAAALTALDEHARRYGSTGILAEERDATRVRALCLAGRDADADRAARAFLVDYPTSVHARLVARGCGDGADPPSPP